MSLLEEMSDRPAAVLRMSIGELAQIAMIQHPNLEPKCLSVESSRLEALDAAQVVYCLVAVSRIGRVPVLNVERRVFATHFARRGDESAGAHEHERIGVTTEALCARVRAE